MGPAEIGQVGAACLEARRSAEKYTLIKCLTVLCCCMWGEGATGVTNYSLPCGCSWILAAGGGQHNSGRAHACCPCPLLTGGMRTRHYFAACDGGRATDATNCSVPCGLYAHCRRARQQFWRTVGRAA